MRGRGGLGVPAMLNSHFRGWGRPLPRLRRPPWLRATMGRVAVCFHAHVTHLEDLRVKVRVGLWAMSVSRPWPQLSA